MYALVQYIKLSNNLQCHAEAKLILDEMNTKFLGNNKRLTIIMMKLPKVL